MQLSNSRIIPWIVRTVVGVDDKAVVKTNKAVCNLYWVRTAVFQRRQQPSVIQTLQ